MVEHKTCGMQASKPAAHHRELCTILMFILYLFVFFYGHCTISQYSAVGGLEV